MPRKVRKAIACLTFTVVLCTTSFLSFQHVGTLILGLFIVVVNVTAS